jgi:hypothetical protein
MLSGQAAITFASRKAGLDFLEIRYFDWTGVSAKTFHIHT